MILPAILGLAQLWPAMEAAGVAGGYGRADVVAARRRLLTLQIRTAAVDRQQILILSGLSPPVSAGLWWPEVAELTGADQIATAKGAPDTALPETATLALPADWLVLCDPRLSALRARAALSQWQGPALARRRAVLDGPELVAAGLSAPILAAECLAELLHDAPTLRFGHQGRLWLLA